MEKTDHELLLAITSSDPALKKLYNEHLKLEKQVERFGRYATYSASARLRHQKLKKEKLRGMDSIMAILRKHKETEYCTAS